MVELAPFGAVQRLKQISDTIRARSIGIVAEKKAALERGDEALKEQVGRGKDIMSVLREWTTRCGSDISVFLLMYGSFDAVRANMSASAEDQLSDEEVLAQVS